MCSCGPLHMANQKQDDQLKHSYSSYVMIRDVTPKTCRRRWMIGRRGDIRASRTSGISVLAARHDDDDDIYITQNLQGMIQWIKSSSENFMFCHHGTFSYCRIYFQFLQYIYLRIVQKVIYCDTCGITDWFWRCPWCNGYRRRKWTRRTSSNPGRDW